MSTPEGQTPNRRYPRLRCFVAVSLRAKDADLFFWGNLSSVGLGGCGVETTTPVEIGVAVEIASVEDERVAVVGDVVNRRVLVDRPGFGIGIEFMDTGDRKAGFVKFVEEKTQVDAQEYWYLTQMRKPEE
jgi:PilZ domain-containing protein